MDEQLELPSQDVPALPVDLDKSDEQLGLELQDVPSPVDLDELDEQLGLQPELEAPGLPINLRLPPPLKDSEETLEDIKHLLKPPRASGVGHYWAKFPPTSKESLLALTESTLPSDSDVMMQESSGTDSSSSDSQSSRSNNESNTTTFSLSKLPEENPPETISPAKLGPSAGTRASAASSRPSLTAKTQNTPTTRSSGLWPWLVEIGCYPQAIVT
ncbi:hypothetical protein V8E55_002586 [Tylopilus felleus]